MTRSILLCCCFSLLFAFQYSHAKDYKIGIMVYDTVTTTDLLAPIDVFANADQAAWIDRFEVVTIAADRTPVTTHQGLTIIPDRIFTEVDALDVLIVPSAHDKSLLKDQAIRAFILKHAKTAQFIAAHCAAAFALADVGLLDGRRATTFKGGENRLKREFPTTTVLDDVHVVVDGNIMTSNGGLMSYEASLLLLSLLTDDGFAKKVGDRFYYSRMLEEGRLAVINRPKPKQSANESKN